MIKELSRDLVTLIHKDYPELEELNLSNNGKSFLDNSSNTRYAQRSLSSKTLTSSAAQC